MNRLNTVGGHKTAIFTDQNGLLCVKFHNTVVWRKHADGGVTLCTGGYKTKTTKLRMNQAFNQFGPAGFAVVQRNYEWFVVAPTGAEVPFTGRDLTLAVSP